MVFYCGVIKSNFISLIQWHQLSLSPRYIPISLCSLFQSPRSSSIKLMAPQAWIMQIAQPNYLMATNFPASSLITFQSYIFIFILWSPTDTCLGILTHLSFPGVCLFLKVWIHACQFSKGCTKSAKIFPGCNSRWKYEGLRDTSPHRPPRHPEVLLCGFSREAFQRKCITAGTGIFYRYHTKSLEHVWDFQFDLRY